MAEKNNKNREKKKVQEELKKEKKEKKKYKQIERKNCKQIERKNCKQIERKNCKQIERKKDKNRQTNTNKEKQKNKKTETTKQTETNKPTQTKTKTEKQTNKETETTKQTEKETILVFCAHNDDQIVGPGGTLAKYSKEGKKFITYVFSFGETSHLHYKREVIAKIRVREAQESDKILGGSGIFFFGLKEGKFEAEMKQRELKEKIKEKIKEHKPSKIFTHSPDDPHPDHRATIKTIIEILDEMNKKIDVYAFNVWNPLNISKRNTPKLVVDTTKTFDKKIKAFLAHKSQKVAIASLIGGIYIRDMINGLKHKTKKSRSIL